MDMEMVEGQMAVEEDAGIGVKAEEAALMERLASAITALERVTEQIRLEQRMHASHAEGGEQRARSAAEPVRRKTIPFSVTNLLTKQGVSVEALAGEGIQASALDAALVSLSLEQRIAVKAELMRAGVLG